MNKNINHALSELDYQHCQYPFAVHQENGLSFVVWTESIKGQDVIILNSVQDNLVIERLQISEPDTQALKSTACMYAGKLYIAYNSCKDQTWTIHLKEVIDMKVSASYEVAKGEAEFYPVLCPTVQGLLVAWTSQTKRKSMIISRTLVDGHLSTPEKLSLSELAYRPSLVQGKQDALFLTYDRFNGSSYDVIVRVRTKGRWGEERQINAEDGRWSASPIVVQTKDGALVGWYDIAKGASFSFKSAALMMEDNRLVVEEPVQLAGAMDWYQNISLGSNGETVAFAYTWGKNNIHVRLTEDKRTWSEPVIMSLSDTNCAVHPHITVDKTSVHLAWQFALKNGHQQVRNAQIFASSLTISEFASFSNSEAELKQVQFTLPIPTPKQFPSPKKEAIAGWLKKNGYGELTPYFGDIHGQSGISDGMGEIDQYFHFAQVGANLDFTALTDHDCYPDWMTGSEWEWIRTTAKLHNKDGELTTFLSYEWTPNEYRYDFGHKNVYYPGDAGELFRSGDYYGMTPDRLFAKVKEYGAMAFPHHPAATWTMVSAATDWAFHDEEVQRQVEIYSRHAPFEYYGNSSIYTKNNPQLKHCSAQDALALGYHMGFIAGSDSHQLEHGIEGGILGVLTKQLNREEVFQALYDRASWATTGARILLDLKVNGKKMGSIQHQEEGTAISLQASVLGTTSMKVELIKDNEVIYTQDSELQECDFSFQDTKGEKNAFYYLRVTQADAHQGWSSPIWVEK